MTLEQAMEQLVEANTRIAKLEEALRWYATFMHYRPGLNVTSSGSHRASNVECDAGARARKVLEGEDAA
jgi:hypothetical protein